MIRYGSKFPESITLKDGTVVQGHNFAEMIIPSLETKFAHKVGVDELYRMDIIGNRVYVNMRTSYEGILMSNTDTIFDSVPGETLGFMSPSEVTKLI